jgi:WhiB family transcriptional regulator, redox-sensing transcriptional regulator
VTAEPRRSGGRHLARLVLPAGVDTEWQRRAACRTVEEPDVFFPSNAEAGEAAKRICARCPVLGECLAFALATMPRPREDHGVYGGLLPTERSRLRRSPLLVQAHHLHGRTQAVIGRRLTHELGMDATARALGVTETALTDAWRRYGLAKKPKRATARPVHEELYRDRAAAERAHGLASRVGVVKAATALGVSHGTLYRAWQRHGLDRPAPQPRGRLIGPRRHPTEREEVAEHGEQ